MFFVKELQEKCMNAAEINSGNCLKIVQDNQDTVFGQIYGFSEIKTVDEYRHKVPLSDYSSYRTCIEAMRRGDKNQLTAYEVLGYCKTSGTENNPKYIPITRTELTQYGDYFERYHDKVLQEAGGMRLHINCFRAIPGRSLDVTLFSEILYKTLMEQGYLDMNTFVGGTELMFEEQPGDILFAKVWAALLEENISVIESIFLYDQLIFFGYMEEHYREILDSIRTQKIPVGIQLPDEVKKVLLSIPVSVERLEKTEQEFQTGFQNIARRLWPGLRLISGISNRAFFSEDLALQRYVSDVPKYYFCYGASECCMGFPAAEDDFGYVLMPDYGFFEFLPHEGDSKETLLPHELKMGGLYELVITNFAGLYRYKMGDIVKVVGYHEQTPVIEVEFRKNQVLNIAGEKVNIVQLERAVNELDASGVKLEQYCVRTSLEELPGKYLAAAVIGNGSREITPKELSSMLDEFLQKQNEDYRDLRNMGHLDMLEAAVFERDDYYKFLEENGFAEGHNKPKHIMLKKESGKNG